jgi:putative transposase
MVRRPLPWFAIFRLVNQQQLLRNEYLAPENRILRAQLPKRMLLTDPQRCTLADTGRRLGRKVRRARRVVKPDTILGWYRRLIAEKFDGSRYRAYPGRPRIGRELSELVVQMARENRI